MKCATFRHAGRVGVGVPTPGEVHLQTLLWPDGAVSQGLLARHHPT